VGRRRGAAVASAAAAAGLVGVIAVGALVGFGRPGTPDRPDPSAASPQEAAAAAEGRSGELGAQVPADAPGEMPEARLHPAARGRRIELLDGLHDGAVVRLRPDGFAADRTGTIRQCVVDRALRCHDPFPVRFDQHGQADVQFQLRLGWPAGGDTARCTSSQRCVLEVSDGDDVAYLDTAFGDGVQADVRLELPDGAVVRSGRATPVRVGGQVPDGARLAICRDLGALPSRCTTVGPALGRSPGGPATTVAFALPAPLERACSNRECTLTASWDGRPLRADALAVTVQDVTAVDYDPRRVVAGLVAAAALVAGAAVCWRRTDWSAPRSASGAEIDDAAFADLDAEALLDGTEGPGHPIAVRTRP
jgi:hypothetical protein